MIFQILKLRTVWKDKLNTVNNDFYCSQLLLKIGTVKLTFYCDGSARTVYTVAHRIKNSIRAKNNHTVSSGI